MPANIATSTTTLETGAAESMYQRLDQLAALGTTVVTISGGEPLLHPELDDIIRHIRKNGMIAGMITNGYLSGRGPH